MFDTTISVTSKSEIVILRNILNRKEKVRVCQGHGNIQYFSNNRIVFSVKFHLGCNFAQFHYNKKVFNRRIMSIEGNALLTKYLNEILKSVGSDWQVIH